MTAAPPIHPVLMLGGYGSLGSRVTRLLRGLHPQLPITIVGRDTAKAAALAAEVGNAAIARVDLDRADLGLPGDAPYGIVVTALRDLSLNTLRFAQARGIPYVALSDGVFEIGPLVARYVHHPAAAPIVMLGHGMGSVPTLAALYLARGFSSVDAIELGLLFDPEDPLGPASAVDMERIGRVGPAPLLLRGGRWTWGGDGAVRAFASVDGTAHAGEAVGLMDVLSLSSTAAASIRVDFAEGITASRRRGEPASHEVMIDIVGERADGASGRFRYALVDPEGYAALSARGVVVVIERLLGLAGGPPPGPGLYLPEMLVDPAHLVDTLQRLGIHIVELGPRE